jgi:hypothetical protein
MQAIVLSRIEKCCCARVVAVLTLAKGMREMNYFFPAKIKTEKVTLQ